METLVIAGIIGAFGYGTMKKKSNTSAGILNHSNPLPEVVKKNLNVVDNNPHSTPIQSTTVVTNKQPPTRSNTTQPVKPVVRGEMTTEHLTFKPYSNDMRSGQKMFAKSLPFV